MGQLRADRQDLAVSKAYGALNDALAAKAGILARLTRSPAPLTGVDIQHLVDTEENFLKLRTALRGAIGDLNRFIAGIRTT
jgi:hypothetical protein